MKRRLLSISIVVLLMIFSGCNKNKAGNENLNTTTTPTPPITTLTPEEVTDEDTSGTDADQENNTLKLQNYYPIQADTEYVYEGKGNEYASYNVFTDFVDSVNNKVQTRMNNGGSETVKVIEIKDGKVSVIFIKSECYYRDNFMSETAIKDPEILLMEPLKKGTKWTLPDGNKRYISAMDVEVETPSGKYKAIEVTTEYEDSTTKDYYAPQVGHVKSEFSSGDMEVSSTLSEIKTNTPFTQRIAVYYPDTDEKIHAETLTLSFRTGDITRKVLQVALRQKAIKESYLQLVSPKTSINSLYLGDDNIVYLDFSADFVNDMNLGAGFESAVLQCITNTLGNYYGVDKVYITIDSKPYASGHILMKKGETFKVNMDSVVNQ